MKKVLLLLCEGTEIYEAAAFYDVLGWSGSEGGVTVQVVTVGLRTPIRCAFGLKVAPDISFAAVDVEAYDALAIPGGFETYGFYTDAYSEPVTQLIQRFNELKKPIATVCVGALPVAHAGILTGRKGTTYAGLGSKRRDQMAAFGVQVIDADIVQDENVLTSTGPVTAVDVAFALLEELTGIENTEKIRLLMGFG